ncbi:MAG: hypothetical protein Q9170_000373 [Blastenia crenularia]
MEKGQVAMDSAARSPKSSAARASPASFLSRVASSASGLIQESIVRPNPKLLIDDFASSAGSASKRNEPSSSSGPQATCLSQESEATYSSSAGKEIVCPTNHKFRSNPPLENQQAAEAQFGFFLDLQDRDASKPEPYAHRRVPDATPSQNGDTGATFPMEDPGIPLSLASWSSGRVGYCVGESDQADGAAVVALLSDPSFNVDDLPEHHHSVGINHNLEEVGAESLDRSISPEWFGLTLPQNQLGLIPAFGGDLTKPYAEDSIQNLNFETVLKEKLGTLRQVAEDGDHFEVQPWIDILTRYHDEVWGDISPYVQAARDEAKSLQDDSNNDRQHCPAIRRLTMVVGHIRYGGGG